MAVKSLSTRIAIIGRGAKCSGGTSAVDRAAYISRTTMYSEYDGTYYYPKYSEDLVHSEVMLPVNAPTEYSDPSVLWNSVEMRESKSAKIAEQIARLEQLLVAYREYEPYIEYHKTSNSMKGFAKRNYDKAHQSELELYANYRAELKKMLSSDEKITPKKWTEQKAQLEAELRESNPDYAKVVTELASTEVIEHNRKMLAVAREAEERQQSRSRSQKKNEQSL